MNDTHSTSLSSTDHSVQLIELALPKAMLRFINAMHATEHVMFIVQQLREQ